MPEWTSAAGFPCAVRCRAAYQGCVVLVVCAALVAFAVLVISSVCVGQELATMLRRGCLL